LKRSHPSNHNCEASKFTSQTIQTKGEKTMNMPTLSIGATGIGVERLQQDLSARGYQLAVNGLFDESTENAVKSFQKDNNLIVDGVVGAQTGQKLGGRP
jgi:peptidoglycan hydrolase-like protein with peptidoglycan-binding domain